MLAFAFYGLKVTLCAAILFGYYWLFLRNKIFHRYNRFYLLASIVISMLAPMMHFNIWHSAETVQAPALRMLQVVNAGDEYLDEVIVYSKAGHVNWESASMFLYVLISVSFLFMMLRALLKIRHLLKHCTAVPLDNIQFIKTDAKGTPFSFFRFIFWNNAIDIQTKTGKQIFKHELAHVEEKHSLDKLFINIIMVIYWFNPIFWLMRKELNMIHEFIADQKAIEQGDTAEFAAMILHAAYPTQQFDLGNSFFHSPIKRRLLMLHKNKSRIGYFSRLLALPLILFLLAAFSLKAKTYVVDQQKPTQSILKVVVDAGHGGADRGAVSTNGIEEKNMSLALVKKISELNTNKQLQIILVRDKDQTLTLKERSAFSKESGADLFISVHIDTENSEEVTGKSGLSVRVARNEFANSESSNLLASAVIQTFQSQYSLPVAKNPLQQQRNIWILQHVTCPAILVEAGYLSNRKDVEYLQSTDGMEDFARNMLKAIEQYAAAKSSIRSIPSVNEDAKTTSTNKTSLAPGKMDLPDFRESLENAKKSERVNASQDVVINGQNHTVTNKARDLGLPVNENYLYVLNTRPVSAETIRRLSASGFQTLRKLEPADAMQKYGEKGAHGAIELTTAPDPGFSLSGIKSSRIRLTELKNIKELLCDDEHYIIKSFDVYFHGEGFPHVQVVQLTDASLSPAQELMNKLISGSSMTFDNVRIARKDGSGLKTIAGKSFSFYDKDIAVSLSQNDSATVYRKVQEEASFPGGPDGWRKYLQKNLDANIPTNEGWKAGTYKIMIQFIVDKEGNVRDVKSINYKDSKTAAACVALIRNGPKWLPATQNGKKVSAIRNQPITFVIE